ncbi:hypothetical protein V6N13_133433 [Hibiscus sabdariffa]
MKTRFTITSCQSIWKLIWILFHIGTAAVADVEIEFQATNERPSVEPCPGSWYGFYFSLIPLLLLLLKSRGWQSGNLQTSATTTIPMAMESLAVPTATTSVSMRTGTIVDTFTPHHSIKLVIFFRFKHRGKKNN